MALTPEDQEYLRKQGIDPSQVVEVPEEKMSMGRAAVNTLESHAGSILGGGAGTLAGAAAGEAIFPFGGGIPGAIIGGIAGGGLGGYGGEKLQQAVLPREMEQELQQQGKEAEEAHPRVSQATDIIANALASGGKPSIGNLTQAGKAVLAGELKNPALLKVALGAAINPAIDTGATYAATGQLPTGKDIAMDIGGGALFSEPSALGKMFHRPLSTEPLAEPRASDTPIVPLEASGIAQENTDGNSPPPDPNNKDEVTQNKMEDQPAVSKSPIDMEEEHKDEESLGKIALDTDKDTTRDKIKDQIQQAISANEEQQQTDTGPVNESERLRLAGKQLSENLPEDEQRELEGVSLNAPQAQDYSPEDLQRYQELKQKIQDLTQTGNIHGPELQTAFKQFEDVRNKYGGMPPLDKPVEDSTRPLFGKTVNSSPELINHIMTGNATTGSVLNLMSHAPDSDMSGVAKHLRNIADSQSLSVPWRLESDPKQSSAYWAGQDTVKMNPSQIGDARNVIEEAIHSMTSRKLIPLGKAQGAEYFGRLNHYLQTGPNESVKDLIKAYYTTADAMGIRDFLFKQGGNAGRPQEAYSQAPTGKGGAFYAMGSLDEFIAHAFKNEQFQRILNEIPYEEHKSVWQHIVQSVKKLLGFDVKTGHMLDHVLRTSSDLISQTRPPSFNKLNAIQIGRPTEVLPREQSKAGETGSERLGMGRSEQGEEAPIEALKTSDRKPEDTTPEIKPVRTMGFVGRAFRAGLDTIRAINHPAAKGVADAFQRTFEDKEHILGTQLNPVMEAAHKLSSRDSAQLDRVMRYEIENQQKAPATMFENAQQREAYNAARASLDKNFQYRWQNEEPVYRGGRPTMPQRDPFYWPTTTNPKVAQVLRENSDTGEIAKLKKTFTDYQQKMRVSPEGAESNWKDFSRAVQGNSQSVGGNATFFNAARRAQGISLPPEFTRPGWAKNLEAYFHAQAADNAYYKNVESNHQVLAALGEQKDAWGRPVQPLEDGGIAGNTAVKNVVQELKGEAVSGQQGQVIKKSESLATAMLLGPQTEIHKPISNWFKTLSYTDNPYQAARVIAHGISSWGEGWTHAKENGKVVMTARSAGDMFNSQLTAADRLAGLARGLRQVYTLGDLTEKFNLGALQAMNEALIPYKIKSAAEGNQAAMRLMRHLDTTWAPDKTYSQSDVSKLASNLSGVIHGTRDARTLPSWMLHDNEISAFLKLSSWGIAQTNSFMRDVYTPATEGHFGPLLNAAFGAAVGGYLLKELREKLSGKKSQIPSLSEIASSSRGIQGNIPAVAYNMMAAASYAGFGGMLSTIARYPFDWAFRNTPQGATFPLDTVLTDLASTVSKAAEAISNDPNLNWLELASQVGNHIVSSDFQLGRVALNNAINTGAITGTLAEKKQLSDKLGQLRRFEMVEGLPYDSQDQASGNPYMNLEQKKFKLDEDLPEAMHMVPQLVNSIIQKYGDKPDVLMQKLKGLKENQYATFPSIESAPLSFFKYMSYLNRMEGPEKAQAALMDYMQHKMQNQVKSSVVP